MDEEILIGRNPVIEALRAGRSVNKIYLSDQINHQTEREIRNYAKKVNAVVQKVPKSRLDKISKGKHQGIVAYVTPYQYSTIAEILECAEKKSELPFILILDELEDPHNLGAILRTADATGVHGIIIPKRRAVGLTETVAKASAGAIEHVPVARVTNIAKAIDELKDNNIWVVGTDERGSKDYRTLDGETAIALVIGNEGKGISRLVKDKCDWTIHLPMKGSIPSLNASVAAGILMYEIYRNRHPLGEDG